MSNINQLHEMNNFVIGKLSPKTKGKQIFDDDKEQQIRESLV